MAGCIFLYFFCSLSLHLSVFFVYFCLFFHSFYFGVSLFSFVSDFIDRASFRTFISNLLYVYIAIKKRGKKKLPVAAVNYILIVEYSSL